jgi:hypothetical protein
VENKGMVMHKLDEQILRASKEIIVKFIETGRVSPTGFPEAFKVVYDAVHETVLNPGEPDIEKESAKKKKKK